VGWNPEHAPAILADLTRLLAEAVESWRLLEVEALRGGAIAFVCAATRADAPAVLKVNPLPPDGIVPDEAGALHAWGPGGAVVKLLGALAGELHRSAIAGADFPNLSESEKAAEWRVGLANYPRAAAQLECLLSYWGHPRSCTMTCTWTTCCGTANAGASSTLNLISATRTPTSRDC
jgi:hypothetical protein